MKSSEKQSTDIELETYTEKTDSYYIFIFV